MPVMREIKTPLNLFNIRYFQDEKGQYYKKKGDNHRKRVRPFWKMKRIMLGIPLLVLLALGVAGYKIGMSLASEKIVDELASQIKKEDYDKILKDPSIQQIIEKEVGTDKNSELLKNISSDPTIKDTISKDPASVKGEETPVATTVNTNNEKNLVTSKTDSSKDKDNVATVDTNKGKTATEEKQQPAVEKEEPGLRFNSSSEVTKFLLSKFSMSELSALAKKAEGGVTPQEKAEIKSTVLGRLSTEEYNAVKVFAVVEASKRK
ncbi:hypothetical protein KW850_03435 [Bacillus sp. sid0103]|uniref:hypothetical protein n=1 Tax=Bacillus sp. sid0103 TaxID=2856337 RepID=UPI001C463280|nr:hypothetical protein [Bacillus sp. sid0103]MBV7504319.1 hypothetical protein [Bacillus sp. sid0103]